MTKRREKTRRGHAVTMGKHGRFNFHFIIFLSQIKVTLFLWSEIKAKWGRATGRGRRRQARQRLIKRDGGSEPSLTDMVLMIPHSVSQLQIKTTSAQKQRRSPELQNNLIGSARRYKGVGGWVYSLWSVLIPRFLPIVSHSAFFTEWFKSTQRRCTTGTDYKDHRLHRFLINSCQTPWEMQVFSQTDAFSWMLFLPASGFGEQHKIKMSSAGNPSRCHRGQRGSKMLRPQRTFCL